MFQEKKFEWLVRMFFWDKLKVEQSLPLPWKGKIFWEKILDMLSKNNLIAHLYLKHLKLYHHILF